MVRRYKRRRGVVILVVLSLLVLFTLLVVTYAIVSGQYRRAAEAFARQELLGVQPQRDLDRAFYQILRDTNQRNSAVRFHSLLRDYYGEDGFTGRLAVNTAANPLIQDWNTNASFIAAGGHAYTLSRGQFRDLIVADSPLPLGPGNPDYPPGFCVGRMLTITSGRASGWTTTIVGFFYRPDDLPVIRVLDLPNDTIEGIAWQDLNEASFVVNGRPFSGSGVGFRIVDDVDPVSGEAVQVPRLDAPVTVTTSAGSIDVPAALLPHHVARDVNGDLIAPILGVSATDPNHNLFRGGSNEPYDAVDYHNMFLGLVLPDATTSRDIIPSFHRPALINYWIENFSTHWADDNFKRLVSLRPVEPNFDGSNAEFAAAWAVYQSNPNLPANVEALRQRYVYGPWDVDNDGDGIPDSIWIDLGMPVQTAPDGRKYKPLFAVLCVDLDGRLNVNAHGNPTEFYQHRPQPVAQTNPYHMAAGNTVGFPKGLGYGPPEIALQAVTSNLSQLMFRRYQPTGVPGIAGGDGLVANDQAFDLLARVKFFEESPNYFNNAQPTSYSTPPDLRGELAFGLDLFGRPVWEQVPSVVLEARADSPYEINLLDRSASDRPFTPHELERVLRAFDLDVAQLPNRLSELIPADRRRLVTTDSFDPPVPGTAMFSDLASHLVSAGATPASLGNVRSVQELVTARMLASGVPANSIANLLKNLLPSEVLLGQRMDINRLLGNGRDGTPVGQPGHGLVDEVVNPIDPSMNEQVDERIWGNVGAPHAEYQNVPIYHTNGQDVNNDDQLTIQDHILARQLLARHIYVLLMALKDSSFLIEDANGNPSEAETARALAQYAVNIVDFRDADSIMTPFFYDPYPFNSDGWNPPGTDVVWGCERPELVISETLAWHERRTEDTDEEDDGPLGEDEGTFTHDDENPDPDFDQRLMPRGSFFVELFNPWTAPTDLRPAELYDLTGPIHGVELNRVATSHGISSPVWRLMFVKDETPGSPKDPDDPVPSRRPNPQPNGVDETRLIYFVNPDDAKFIDPSDPGFLGPLNPTIGGVAGAFGTTLPVSLLAPGRYAVIGSSGIEHNNSYYSPVGRRAEITRAEEADFGSMNVAGTRAVVLSPGAGGHQVRIQNNGPALPAQPADPNDPNIPGTYVNYPNPQGTNTPYITGQPADTNILPAQAIVINTPRSLSVSDPLEGYAAHPDYVGYQSPAVTDTLEGYYAPARDKPFDLNRYIGQLMVDGTMVWGTIHLQRLANPLIPWNPMLGEAGHDPSRMVNPYRTIDSMRVDLTSMNGVNPVGSEMVNINQSIPTGHHRLFAVQRGDQQGGTRRFWPQEPPAEPQQQADWGVDPPDPATNLPTHYFNYQFRTTLGALNHGFWPYNGQMANLYRGSPSVDIADAPTRNDHPFSSLAWHNRPFVSAYELMQVPATRSSELLTWYSLASALAANESPYNSETHQLVSQYGHLANFFHSAPFRQVAPSPSAHVYRLLEYVQVPSRFVGTDYLLDPGADPSINSAAFRNHLLPSPPYPADTRNHIANPASLNPSFLTPFNRVSRYRDPGRVNINTIYDSRVWNALFGGYTGQSYETVMGSRRGFPAAVNTLLPDPDPSVPTYFANPFRPPGHGSLVPLQHLERRDVETTLLRSHPDPTDPRLADRTPLLEGGHVGQNLATTTSTHPRNSHFRYNALRRLGNMVTTRSNVYAIWITVGYFEVEPNILPGETYPTVDVFHPDGFRVGQELGSDTGQIRRHRAFFIVDRTIPVAFQPGENHNVDRCVLLRRFIE